VPEGVLGRRVVAMEVPSNARLTSSIRQIIVACAMRRRGKAVFISERCLLTGVRLVSGLEIKGTRRDAVIRWTINSYAVPSGCE